MKKLFVLLNCMVGLFAYGQEVQKDFTKILLEEDFNNGDKNWNSTFNIDNLFIAQNGYYELFRRSEKSGYFILPKEAIEYSAFELETAITFAEHDNKKQSAGVLLMAKDNSSGLLVEINQKREFRILRIYKDKQVVKTGNGNGWIKASQLLTKAVNTITIKTYDKVYDLYLNGAFAISFTEIELNKGMVGLYVGANSKIKYDYLKIKGEEKTDLSTLEVSNVKEEEKAFTQIIINLKSQINKKDKEIDELKSKLKLAGTGAPVTGTRDTALINERNRLNNKVSELESDNQNLQLQLMAVEEEKKKLEEFKAGVQNSQENGDIIINLTNMVGNQKQKIEELEQRNKSLNSENNSLFIETKDLTKQLDNKTNALTTEQAKNLKLKYELDSLKKMVTALNDSLKAKNAAIKKAETPTPEQQLSEEEKLQQMIEKERLERLKRKEEEEKKKKEEEEQQGGNGNG